MLFCMTAAGYISGTTGMKTIPRIGICTVGALTGGDRQESEVEVANTHIGIQTMRISGRIISCGKFL
jgi:hypothetical protein